MRIELAAAVGALCLLAAGGAAAQSAPGWSYGYVEGAATATRVDGDGRVEATMVCRPPDGALVFTAHTFNRAARNVSTAQLQVGQGLAINVPASSEGRGRRARVIVNLPRRPPILAGVQPRDELTVTVNGVSQSFGPGSGKQMEDVAYACWTGGS